MKWYGIKKIDFENINFFAWKFSKSVDISEHIRNNTLYRLYAHDSPEGALSNSDCVIDGIILTINTFVQN